MNTAYEVARGLGSAQKIALSQIVPRISAYDGKHINHLQCQTAEASQVSFFKPSELQAMHKWCCDFQNFVRLDGQPTSEQEERFMLYHRIVYSEGMRHEQRPIYG